MKTLRWNADGELVANLGLSDYILRTIAVFSPGGTRILTMSLPISMTAPLLMAAPRNCGTRTARCLRLYLSVGY